VIVPLRSKRRERAVLVQKLQHAVPGAMLLFAGFQAIQDEVRGFALALAVFEIACSLLLIASVIAGLRKVIRPASVEHAPHLHHGGIDWIDVFTGALLFAEVGEHWHLKHHLARPTILLASVLVIVGLFHGRFKRRAERRFTIRVDDDHLYVGGKPFRSLREKWADIASVDLDSRYGTIRTRAGRTRRLDLRDLEGANHVRAALEEARRRLATDEARAAEG
jgi:hypothetical protein